jgi:hypothetical protein
MHYVSLFVVQQCLPRSQVGVRNELDFLVQEGQIRAEAVVRHVHSGRGVGLKFTAVRNGDHLNLASLLNRLGRSS